VLYPAGVLRLVHDVGTKDEVERAGEGHLGRRTRCGGVRPVQEASADGNGGRGWHGGRRGWKVGGDVGLEVG
jgi:hypothetical protein